MSFNITIYTRIDVDNYNEYNGAHLRLQAWKIVFKNVQINNLSNFTLHDKKDVVLIDYPGIRLRDMLRLRSHGRLGYTMLYMQDNQFRFWLSALKTGFRLKWFFNSVRALIRISVASCLFKKLLFISDIDALMFGAAIPIMKDNVDIFKGPKQPVERLVILSSTDYLPNDHALNAIFSRGLIDRFLELSIVLEIRGRGTESFNIQNVKTGAFNSFDDFVDGRTILILPATFGSGIKNKILEAQRHGIPLMYHKSCRFEYPYSIRDSFVYNSYDDLIGFLRFYQSSNECLALSAIRYRLQ